jgi:chromosome segregation ATPase
MFNLCHVVFAVLVLAPGASSVSPVQKVVELLDECKAKIQKDLDAEAASMGEYTTFCDDELKDKAYAIATASRSIGDLMATVSDANAKEAMLADEIATLGSTLAAKSGELAAASKVREEGNADFVAAEGELLTSIDQLGRAASILKKGMSFAQVPSKKLKKIQAVVSALQTVVEASWVDVSSKRKLKSFLQAQAQAADEDDFSLTQPQAKMIAYSASSGSIVKTVEEMQGKAEDTLATLRRKEMGDAQTFAMLKSGLEDQIKHGGEKLSTATSGKAAAIESAADSAAKKVETEKSKAADEEYASTLKTDCETKAAEWEARQKSASEEMGAVTKAKDILLSGVKAFIQTKSKMHKKSQDADDDSDATDAIREKVVGVLQKLAADHHSFALNQVASVARSDPFVKIRGLIESMIAKLLKEAQEEATREAWCQEETGKSKTSQEEKTATLDKLNTRIDGATSTIAELTEAIKTLESEVASIDKAQAEATALRSKENADYLQASKDFKDSAEAVAKVIEVLKNFYSGALIQIASKTSSKAAQPSFGSAQGDTAHTIISVLEMSEEDFTTLLAETESTEDGAAKAYETLTDENKVSKAAKLADAKAKASEVKSLKVQLEHHKEDKGSVSAELEAVLAYLAKLKPECESAVVSYAEKKAAREAEISGLKEALSILEGQAVFAQTGRRLRAVRRA